MNKAAEKLDKYNQEQKIFFQNVSHELRTPLQSIKSNAEAIVYKIMDHKKASQIIIAETDRLTEMVDGLLYFSYLDTVNGQMMTEMHDLREILSSCVERQHSLAEDQDIQFDFCFEKTPVMISCDEKRLYRAFSNVVSNAIRYAKKTIRVSCLYENKMAIISIADDGEGILPEELPYIFDRFYKGHRGNHGIGLSIVKTVTEQHDGSIEVTSSGDGSIFTFRFPTR
jgi:signal transduction histidine kinase